MSSSASAPGPRKLVAAIAGMVAGVVAALALLVSGDLTHAFAATGLLDVGTGVRFALPLVTLVVELALAATAGASVVAATVLPWGDGPHGRAFARVMVLASGGAAVWALGTIAQVVLTYSEAAGIAPSDPAFGDGLGPFVVHDATGRALVGAAIVAALVCMASLAVRTPTGAASAFALALVGVAFEVGTGQASGGSNHQVAVAALFVHVAAASVWVGSLGAVGVAVAMGRERADAADALARYSQIALWCLGLVGVSGLAASWVGAGSWSGLTTGYGALILVKVVLLCGLGALAYGHRRAVVARVARGDGRTGRLLGRLVAVEFAVLGAAAGVAVALATTGSPVAGATSSRLTAAERVTGRALPPAPSLARWFTEPSWDVIVAILCAAGLVVYVRWVRRVHSAGLRHRPGATVASWPARRIMSWVCGVLVLSWVTSGGPALYGRYLVSAHVAQLLVCATLVPLLLMAAAPAGLASLALGAREDGSRGPREWLLVVTRSRVLRVVERPDVAAALLVVALAAALYTNALTWSLDSYAGRAITTIVVVGLGCLLARGLLGATNGSGPGGRRLLVRVLVIVGFGACLAVLGLALHVSDVLLAPDWYGLLGRTWGPSAIDDQQRAGVAVWCIGALWLLVLAAGPVVARRLTRAATRPARPRPRRP